MGSETVRSRVAIIGGGFSGMMTAVQLIWKSAVSLEIAIIEPREAVGLGVAYGDAEPWHLLNVRAIGMGAWPDKTDDFWKWCESGRGQKAASDFALVPAADAFLPRALFARYLQDIWQDAMAAAEAKGHMLSHVRGQAVSVRRQDDVWHVAIKTEKGSKEIQADALVLATGNPPAVKLPGEGEGAAVHPGFLRDMWRGNVKQAVSRMAGGTAVIIGTGLTAVDAVLSLLAHGFEGNIIALSRNGLLPRAHVAPGGKAWAMNAPVIRPTVSASLKTLRDEISRARAEGYSWHAVIDSIRPHTVPFWRQWSAKEKKRFFRHAWTLWNIHRHRMAPEIRERLEELRSDGRFRIMPARVQAIEPEGTAIAVRFKRKGARVSETLKADLVIGCTGPAYDVARTPSPLLASLLAQQAIEPAEDGPGIRQEGNGKIAGAYGDSLFALGPLLVAERLETTAVPELRGQAASVADAVLLSLKR